MKIAIQQAIRILNPGTFCSLQDIGRFGFRHMGVPCSGAMDRQSFMHVNATLKNRTDATVLEIFGYGSRFEVLSECVICFSGANAVITLNGDMADFSKPRVCIPGDQIFIEKILVGSILYFGIFSGFYVAPVMGSTSYLKGTHLENLKKGDVLYKNATSRADINQNASIKQYDINPHHKFSVYPGPEFDLLSEESQSLLFSLTFTVTVHSNRMGYRLKSEPLTKSFEHEMLTSAVGPGVVQMLPDGQLIILMRDCQTTGGYPRVLIIDEADINQVAQRKHGDIVKFTIDDRYP